MYLLSSASTDDEAEDEGGCVTYLNTQSQNITVNLISLIPEFESSEPAYYITSLQALHCPLHRALYYYTPALTDLLSLKNLYTNTENTMYPAMSLLFKCSREMQTYVYPKNI